MVVMKEERMTKTTKSAVDNAPIATARYLRLFVNPGTRVLRLTGVRRKANDLGACEMVAVMTLRTCVEGR